MRVLLAHAPNLALTDADGDTALEIAIQQAQSSQIVNENVELVVLLIRAGAPLDEVEREDLCILAATSASAVYALIDRGVVIRDLQGDSGQTPLHWAAQFLSVDCALLSLLVDVCDVDLDVHARGSVCM
jgi:ankyrin repeat protein